MFEQVEAKFLIIFLYVLGLFCLLVILNYDGSIVVITVVSKNVKIVDIDAGIVFA